MYFKVYFTGNHRSLGSSILQIFTYLFCLYPESCLSFCTPTHSSCWKLLVSTKWKDWLIQAKIACLLQIHMHKPHRNWSWVKSLWYFLYVGLEKHGMEKKLKFIYAYAPKRNRQNALVQWTFISFFYLCCENGLCRRKVLPSSCSALPTEVALFLGFRNNRKIRN